MSKRSALIHVARNPEATCASAVLHALIPNGKPSKETVQLFNQGALSPTSIGLAVAIEMHHQTDGVICRIEKIQPGERPSMFFNRAARRAQQDTRATFLGGVINTKDRKGVGHLVAITSVHRGGKITIVDTAPNTPFRDAPNPLVRKVPFATLDRAISTEDCNGMSPAVAITAFNFRRIPPDLRNQMDKSIEKSWVTLQEQKELIETREDL